jgi:hypothetical protein
MIEPIVISGAKEIGKAAGVSWQTLPWYVKNKGLPAWRIDGKGPYLALPDDLREWVRKMRDENLNR